MSTTSDIPNHSNSAGADFLATMEKVPEQMTDALGAFLADHVRGIQFYCDIMDVAGKSDKFFLTICDFGQHLPMEPEELEYMRREAARLRNGKGMLNHIRTVHAPLLHEMLFCMFINTYLQFVTGILKEIFRSRRDMMRSTKTETWETILSFQSIDDLLSFGVEKRVHDLAFLGLRELTSNLRDRNGIDLFPDESDLTRAIRSIEIRNLLTHNRGIINRIILERAGIPSDTLGQKIVVDGYFAIYAGIFFCNSAIEQESRLVAKFHLQTPIRRDKLSLIHSASDDAVGDSKETKHGNKDEK